MSYQTIPQDETHYQHPTSYKKVIIVISIVFSVLTLISFILSGLVADTTFTIFKKY